MPYKRLEDRRRHDAIIRLETREKTRSYARSYYSRNKEKILGYQRRYREDKPDVYRARNQANSLRRYGISLTDFERMRGAQNGLCAICQKPETLLFNGKVRELCVDHAHINADGSGPVRQLLCDKCNKLVGQVHDDPEYARQLLVYLERHKMSDFCKLFKRAA